MSNAEVKEEQETSLEEMFTMLDGIIENLQSEDLSLEDTFKGYKQGLELVDKCNKKIEKIECDIKVLTTESGRREE